MPRSDTKRHTAAVEQMLADGWKWNGEKWIEPPVMVVGLHTTPHWGFVAKRHFEQPVHGRLVYTTVDPIAPFTPINHAQVQLAEAKLQLALIPGAFTPDGALSRLRALVDAAIQSLRECGEKA
jgi:hypothetical protein